MAMGKRGRKTPKRQPAGAQQTAPVRLPRWALAAVVAVVAGAVYLPSLWGDFVYDDVAQIVIDDYIHRPSHLLNVLTFHVLSEDVFDFNRPFMILSLMVDSLLWGRHPFGYHLTNVLLHVACSVLVLLVLADVLNGLARFQELHTPPPPFGRRLQGKQGPPGIAQPHLERLGRSSMRPKWPLSGAMAGALLFAVHPANSEAVCPVTYREDLLVTFTALVVLWIAGRFPSPRRWVNVALGGGCLLATLVAVGSKESGAMIPAILLAYWLLVRRADGWRPWLLLIAASGAITACFMAARFAFEPQQSILFSIKPSYLGGSFTGMLRIQPRYWVFEVAEIFWPGLLCADQTEYAIRGIDLPSALLGLVLLAAVFALAARKMPGIALGGAWFAAGLLPVSNFLPLFHPLADRYLYLPMIGVAMIAAAVINRIGIPSQPGKRAIFAVGALVLLGLLAHASVQRALVWQHALPLWKDTVARNPTSFPACNNLGFAYFRQGDYPRAIAAFEQACRLAPQSADPWAGLAISFEAVGLRAEAARALRTATACDPHYGDSSNLVRALTWEPVDADKLQQVIDRVLAPQPARKTKSIP
jgi:uncharacterized membrane protein